MAPPHGKHGVGNAWQPTTRGERLGVPGRGSPSRRRSRPLWPCRDLPAKATASLPKATASLPKRPPPCLCGRRPAVRAATLSLVRRNPRCLVRPPCLCGPRPAVRAATLSRVHHPAVATAGCWASGGEAARRAGWRREGQGGGAKSEAVSAAGQWHWQGGGATGRGAPRSGPLAPGGGAAWRWPPRRGGRRGSSARGRTGGRQRPTGAGRPVGSDRGGWAHAGQPIRGCQRPR